MLNETLTHFARAITQGEQPSSQTHPAYPNYSLDVAIEVYRNNYRGNLHDALAGAYTVIKQLVGDDFFRFMARRFIEQYPPHSANLHHYGAELADFVADFPPAQELVYLSDVASLEWAYHVAYFAEDIAPLDVGCLARVPPEHYPDLILHTHPACRLVHSAYPIIDIWQAHQADADSDFHIDLGSGACIACVSRAENNTRVSPLSAPEAAWLQAIQEAIPLGEATEHTLLHHADFDLQAALLKFISLNILIGLESGVTP